jgi:hypothetical protein
MDGKLDSFPHHTMPTTGKRRFSKKAYQIGSEANIVGSALLFFLACWLGLASFNHDTHHQGTVLRMIGWMWNPPGVFAMHHTKQFSPPMTIALALLWSQVIGVICGFLFGTASSHLPPE